jgi:flagellar hook protein FlgE
MGFGQGLSGLNAAAENLDVVGNNIANSATKGFKSSTVSFGDVYATSRVGLGVSVAGIDNNFTLGSINGSSSGYHMAIDRPNGFFRMTDSNGAVTYTRNGEFKADANNYITNSSGQNLTGYPAGGIGRNPISLQVPQASIAPEASGNIKVTANLSANAAVIPATTAFDPAKPATFTVSQPVSAYDSLGNEHQMTQYFVKRAAVAGTNQSTYDVYYALEGAAPIAAPQKLTFDASGRMTPANTQATHTFTGVGGASSPAENLTLTFDYTGSTQFGSAQDIKVLADGNSSGTFNGLTVAKDGSLMGTYSNGSTQIIGTVALASFTNMQGLKPSGGNQFISTRESGAATIGQPGTNGLSKITGGALEDSNVDMPRELVALIIGQRNYQANTQVIKTQSDNLQNLLTTLR